MSDIVYSNIQSKSCCLFNQYSAPCSVYPPGECPPEVQAGEAIYQQCVADANSACQGITDAASCSTFYASCGWQYWIC